MTLPPDLQLQLAVQCDAQDCVLVPMSRDLADRLRAQPGETPVLVTARPDEDHGFPFVVLEFIQFFSGRRFGDSP